MNSKILCKHRSVFYLLFILSIFSVQSNAQNNCIKYDIIGGTAPKGDCIWVPFIVYNFDSVLGGQIGITYDPQVLMPIEKWGNSKLRNLDTSVNSFFFHFPTKTIRLVWTDNVNDCKAFLNDGDTIIMIKFKLIGEPGSCTPINISPSRTFDTEFYDCNVNNYCIEEINPQDNDICIGEPVDLCVIAHSCGTLTNTGTITIKPFGGTPLYAVEFIIPPGQPIDLLDSGESKTYFNLFPGVYQIKVTDSSGKDTLINITIGLANPIVILPNLIQQPKCWNESNGIIDLRITGGTGSLTVGWRPLDIFGLTRVNNLGVGTYFVTVMDSLGCLATDSITLFADTMVAQIEIVTDATCADDGKAIARAIGGDPCPPNNAYCFFWTQNPAANNCDSMSMNSGLSGKQSVYVQDCRGCRDTVDFEIKFTGELLDSIVVNPIPCYDSTGMFSAFISSKTTLNIPVSFILRDSTTGMTILGNQNGVDNFISRKLKAGTYILESTDNAGCKRNDTIRLTQPDSLYIITKQIDSTESCSPGNDAFITVDGMGGTPTYNFIWSNSGMGGNISSLNQGTYSVTATDFNGCTATDSFTITKPIGPTIDSFRLMSPTCSGYTNGSVEVLYTLGAVPISQYKWNIPGNSNSSKISNLGVGTYIVTITDANGCTDIDSIVLNPSAGLFITSTNIKNPTCNRLSDGFITISLPNNAPPSVTYLWSNGNQSSVNANLKAGIYCVTIDDQGACPAIDTCFELIEPAKINIQISNVVIPSCATAGTCDGSAIICALGRDSLYQFIWSSGEISQKDTIRCDTAYQLCAGDQFVIVANGNRCQDTLLFNIPEPTPISIDTSFIRPPRCYESNDGQITLLAKGGTGPFQYQWLFPNVNSPTITNLGDSTYYVNIIDSLNCSHLDSVRLRQPDSIRVDIILGSTLDVTCPGKSDGRITTAWTGGNKSKGTFQWTPNINPSDSIATNLPAGRYVLQVTDINGCTGSNEYTILAPPQILVQLTPIDTPKCEDDQIEFSVLQANGGSGPAFRFTINSGAPNDIGELVPLFSGNYAVRIYDKNNCFIDTSIFISNPTNLLSLDFGKDIDSIQLGDSILLDGKLNSSTVIDKIIWNPSNTVSNPSSATSFVSPTKNTLYILTVIDKNGCEVTDRITIIVRNTRRFYAPNIFSPNSDGVNDFFSLQIGQGVKAIKSVQIFDRWGNKVYNLENPIIDSETINTWNGRHANTGDVMNPAVFVYIAEVVFQDGSTIVYRGDLTLMR